MSARGALGDENDGDDTKGADDFEQAMGMTEPDASHRAMGHQPRRVVSWLVCCAALFVGGQALANPCALPLRITEVHVDGLEDPGSEWFELTNAGSVPIDLSAWSFTDQATQGAATEGAIRFDAGMVLPAFASIVIAYDGAQFQAERGRAADYEYGVDSASTIPYLARASDWSSGRTLSLANSADELLLVCGLALRDAVRWGIASDERLAAPSPAYSDAAPQNGPRTFERQSVDPWPTAAGGWVASRCLTPGVAPNPDRAPATQPTRVLVPYGTAVELVLPGRDPDTAQPTFQLDTAGLSGTLTPLGNGRVRYTPPVTAVPLTTSFRFTVSDGCSTTHRERVELHVGPPACDPAQAELLLTKVAPGTDDATLAWVELTNPTAEEIDLSNLALGHGALSSNGLPQSGDGGLVLFPPGAILEPGERLVVAYAAGAFRAALGLDGPVLFELLEWYRDSDLAPSELPLDPRGGSSSVTLPRSNGRAVLYGCDGALVDSLVWGEAPPTGVGPLWAAPPPALPSDSTPLSYARRSLVDTDSPSDWFVARCPTPGASHTGAAPVATPASVPRAELSPLSSRFSATDADSATLSYRGWASAGSLTVAADGAFTFTPPAAGRYILIFEASDGCLADQARVQVCVQTNEVPGNAVDEDCDGFAQCWVDEDGDGFGGSLVGVLPGLGCGGPGLAAIGGDCDDDPGECGEACFPGADELCDGFDNDCSALSADGAEDPRVNADCDADDANACLDDLTLCIEGLVTCADDPSGDTNRIEVCDPANLDEDCDGAADDLDPQGAQGKVLTYVDLDEDGYGAGAGTLLCDPGTRVLVAGDCDDSPDQCGSFCSPGLTESRLANNCGDAFDNDCDGTTDLDDACFAPITCYLDLDRDGFGRAAGAVTVTGPAAGEGCAAYVAPPYAAGSFVAVPGDCDDDPATCGAACRPGLAELCDGFDNDCQPTTADGSADVRVGASCDSPFDLDLCTDDTNVCQGGAIACPNDPDGDAGRIEVCDPLDVDEDCDGGADDADPIGPEGQGGAVGRVTVYRDLDGDGRGGEALPRCDLGPGLVADGGDCDDNPASCGAACRPGLSEGRGANNCADTFDNDCDGQTDSDPECFSLVLCYLDRDRDTFGDFATERLLTGQAAASGCAAFDDGLNPVGAWVGNGLDCDDDPSACGAGCYPGASELCDGIDNDCSAASLDGSGDSRVGAACDGPDANACTDDRRACVSGALACVDVPGGDEGRVEICDESGLDEDCDGGADDLDPDGPPINAPTFYRDLDGDGFGDASHPTRACVAPANTATNALDCDDDPSACGADCHPGRAELCDGRDNDCDRDTTDGSGDAEVGASCDAAADANLCEDDTGACVAGELVCVDVTAGDEDRVEVCDASTPSADEDCDGFADDLDPGGAEGMTLFYRDRDEDGAGDPDDTTLACAPPAGHVAVGGDCDDDPAACGAACAPGLDESAASGRCGDELDNDCDGQTDRGPSCAAATCHLDKDGDGHGDPAVSTSLPLEALAAGCAAYDDGTNPVGVWVASGDDCDDLDEDVHPGATEAPGNEVDEDCDGQLACFTDADGDGVGAEPVVLSATCGEGLSARGGDCDDQPTGCGAACSPSVPELCDQVDNDCDGQTDEVCDRVGVLGGGSGCSGGSGAWGWLTVVLGGLILGLALARPRRRLR